MTTLLGVDAAQRTEAGTKSVNEDCIGLRIPDGELLNTKGIVAAIADGASGHSGKIAAECAVQGFLADYYSTPDPWPVKHSAHKVLTAINHWLYAEGRRAHAEHHGLLTTFSAMVFKASSAHLFHIGDTRVYRLRGNRLKQVTRDHQLTLDDGRSYLSRALGADLNVEIDYQQLPLDPGDLFLLMSDGVYAPLTHSELLNRARALDEDLDALCAGLIEFARVRGSTDNLSCQAVRVTQLPAMDADAYYRRLTELPFPPPLSVGQSLDGYRVLRDLHLSARSQVYLVLDERSQQRVALKTPSPNFSDDPAYIDSFLQEEWIGRRVDHPNVVRVLAPPEHRHFLYYVTEYLEGDTLQQWMHDHPRPGLREVREIVQQIAAGLRAFHRLKTVHRDLKPDNVVIDPHGLVKLIDFGCARIAAFTEMPRPDVIAPPPGTRDYGAPELLKAHAGDERSDQFSLAVIAYRLLTGALPYDRPRSSENQQSLSYEPATRHRPDVPVWMDKALERALHPDPARRYEEISEFVFDLAHPNAAYSEARVTPLLERDPATFWRTAAFVLAALCLYLGYRLLSSS